MRPIAGLRGTAVVTKDGSVEADLAEGLADEAVSITGRLRQLLPVALEP